MLVWVFTVKGVKIIIIYLIIACIFAFNTIKLFFNTVTSHVVILYKNESHG